VGAIELEQYEVDDHSNDHSTYQRQQSEPLLASSSGPIFPPSRYRSREDDSVIKGKRSFFAVTAAFVKHIPLVLGIALAFVLFVSIIISFKRPDTLLRFIGAINATAFDDAAPLISPHSNTSDRNLISYENYTNFPLLPTEYAAECNKLMHGFMRHGEYWEYRPQDVSHHEKIDEHGLPEGYRNAVCNSTITYMLGGHAGLLAELGLMSQIAALAREVCPIFSGLKFSN